MVAEVRSVVVQERRLYVGVHNGLGWVDGPQVMVLEPRAAGSGSTERHRWVGIFLCKKNNCISKLLIYI